MTKKQTLWNVAYVVGVLALIVLLQNFWGQAEIVKIVPYSEFEHALAAGLKQELKAIPSAPISRVGRA